MLYSMSVCIYYNPILSLLKTFIYRRVQSAGELLFQPCQRAEADHTKIGKAFLAGKSVPEPLHQICINVILWLVSPQSTKLCPDDVPKTASRLPPYENAIFIRFGMITISCASS